MFEFYSIFDQSIELLYYFCSVFVYFFYPWASKHWNWLTVQACIQQNKRRTRSSTCSLLAGTTSKPGDKAHLSAAVFHDIFPTFPLGMRRTGGNVAFALFWFALFLLTKEGIFMSSPTRNAVFGIVFSQGMLNSLFGLAKLSPIFALDKFVGVWWWGSWIFFPPGLRACIGLPWVNPLQTQMCKVLQNPKIFQLFCGTSVASECPCPAVSSIICLDPLYPGRFLQFSKLQERKWLEFLNQLKGRKWFG